MNQSLSLPYDAVKACYDDPDQDAVPYKEPEALVNVKFVIEAELNEALFANI